MMSITTTLRICAVIACLLSGAIGAEDVFEQENTEAEELEWPWGNKNKTKNQTSESCYSHKNCTECVASSRRCHWCASDQSCHLKGSVFGCLEGISCDAPPPTPSPTDHKKKNNSCSSHLSCSECALSSSLCHWCAFDNACHEVGSIHGCVSGVNCYSNDRCMRKEPEPLDGFVFPEIGPTKIAIILALGFIILCGSTMCFCFVGGVKGAYDDVAATVAEPRETAPAREPADHDAPVPQEVEDSGGETDEAREGASLLTDDNEAADDYNLMEDGDEEEASPLLPPRVSTSPGGSRRLRCIYNICTVCYVLTVAIVTSCTIGAIRYFPKIPVYDECSDEVAWRSIISKLARGSVEPKFEILMSLANPNHFDVVLDKGEGTFRHKDTTVGTFIIPPTKIDAMSISDFMIIATLAPDKREAISLATEYYKGELVLFADLNALVRMPSLFNYSVEAHIKGREIDVNEMQDRSLCKCPDWKEAKNHTPGF